MRLLRTMPELGTLPVIAMTANATTQRLDAWLAAGMTGFMAKPIDLPQRPQMLVRWLGPT